MSVDDYTREFKVCLELCEAAVLSPGATEAAAKTVVENENLETYLIMGDKIK